MSKNNSQDSLIKPILNHTYVSLTPSAISYCGSGYDSVEQKSHLNIGNLKLTQEDYEICMTHFFRVN